MCEPTTLVTLGLAAASAAATLYSQSQATAAEEGHQNALSIQREQEIEVNQILANRSAAEEQADINQQAVENAEGVSQELQANSTAALEARASQKVASGEAGVSGISVDSLINDVSRKEARYADSVTANLEGFNANAEAQKRGVESKRQGRIASIAPYIKAPVAQPDYLGEAVKFGGAGLKSYKKLKGIE